MGLKRQINRDTPLHVEIWTAHVALLLLLLVLHPATSFSFVKVRRVKLASYRYPGYTRLPPHLSPSGSKACDVRRGAHGLRCAAVALAVSASSVCEANDDEVTPPIFHGGIPEHIVQQQSTDATITPPDEISSGTRNREGPEPTTAVLGDIVLSDWLDTSPFASQGFLPEVVEQDSLSGQVEVVTSGSSGGSRTSQRQDGGGSGNEEEVDAGSAPFRFQQLIQHMWAELSRGDQLEYLGKKGQARLKGALTVLAAYGALREHPLQAGVNSPREAFSDMDFNGDGEVSFEEFVRWYSMSSALDEEEVDDSVTTSDSSGASPPSATINAGGNPAAATPLSGSMLARTTDRFATNLAPTPGGGASRLLADLEKSLTLTDRTRGSAPPPGGQDKLPAASPEDRPVVLSSSATSLGLASTLGLRLGATEVEKEAARERWLAGDTTDLEVEVSGSEQSLSGEASVAKDLEKALELLRVLLKANADADTLIAALASCIIRNPMGRYNLDVIEEQFGPIIRGIVEDRLLLERLPEPTSAESYLAIQQSYGIKPVLDLDDHHAKLMREYLVHLSRDARAVVVHMADLTCRLRESSKTPEYARQSLALEALQLYVPVSNALGLGSSFCELEELGYKAIFPQTYANMALWHRDVKDKSHDIVLDVKRRMLRALRAREDIACKVLGYHIEGRTKGLVSTFRKVFRQNKRATDVHDIIGFRIVVTPRKKSRRVLASTSIDSRGHKKVNPNGHEESEGTERGEGMARHAENGVNVERTEKERQGKKGRVANKKGGSKPARKLFTVKTFPPPYRDADSKLLHDVYEVLVDLFDEVPGRYKNYVDFPKANGYRSVHTTVLHPGGLNMELQVRSAKMHTEAEDGAAAHSLYKGNLENPAEASLFRSKMISKSSPPAQHRKSTHGAVPTDSKAAPPASKDSTSARLKTGYEKVPGKHLDQAGQESNFKHSRNEEP